LRHPRPAAAGVARDVRPALERPRRPALATLHPLGAAAVLDDAARAAALAGEALPGAGPGVSPPRPLRRLDIPERRLHRNRGARRPSALRSPRLRQDGPHSVPALRSLRCTASCSPPRSPPWPSPPPAWPKRGTTTATTGTTATPTRPSATTGRRAKRP